MRALIVDDEIDTAGTLMQTVQALESNGVLEVYACATHALLSGPAVGRIDGSSIRELVVTDSVPIHPDRRPKAATVLSIASLLGEAITRIHTGQSVGALFQ